MSAVREATGMGVRLLGLPPLLSRQTRVLVLGSFPGAASLAARQYYAHPQNQFWKILQAIWSSRPYGVLAGSYENRTKWVLAHGVGVWDVYAACKREGSLDASIRNPQVNDFAGLLQRCPQLQAIAHNGGESYKHACDVAVAMSVAGPSQGAKVPPGGSAAHEVASVGVSFYKLPSTSPANASWSFERKLAAWREVFVQHGLA